MFATNGNNGMVTRELMGLRSQLNKGNYEMTNGANDLRKGLQLGSGAPNAMKNSGNLGRMVKENATGPTSIKQLAQNTGMDVDYYSGEPQYNMPHPWQRLVKPLSPNIPAPSIGELALLHKADPRNMDVIRMENAMMNQGNPLTILNPAQWNMMMARCQMAQEDDEYKYWTPRDAWNGWSVDGVVEGDDSTGSNIPSTRRNKKMIIITKGCVEVNPYWKNVIPGSHVWMIIKKYGSVINDGKASQQDQQYVLNTRSNEGGSNNVMSLGLAKRRPFQIGFYSMTCGGTLPMEVLQWEDDMGYQRYDGFPIYVGMVYDIKRSNLTYDNSYVFTDSASSSNNMRPFVNSNENLSTHTNKKYHIILNCHDGICPI
jgi:hypothetical protein